MLERALKLAVSTLKLAKEEGRSFKSAFQEAFTQLPGLTREEAGIAYRIAYEALKRKNLLDHLCKSLVGREVYARLEPTARHILRILVYEFRVKEKTPKKKLSSYLKALRKVYGWDTLSPIEPYLGRLRYVRWKPRLIDDIERLSLAYGQPRWIVEYFIRLLGRTETIKLLESFSSKPPVYVRVNTFKAEEEDTVKNLEAEGYSLKPVNGIPHLYHLESGVKPIVASKSYRKGFIQTQDLSSCYAVAALNLKPGIRIIDVCAAPGVKTSYLAQLTEGKAEIISVDVSRRRVNVMRKMLTRMEVKNVNLIVADGGNPPLNPEVKADVVMVDPPCSGIGILHKDPSFKWRITPKSLGYFSRLQYRLIEAASIYVKPGGYLAYSTCSLTVEENELVIERFLKLNPEFTLSKLRLDLGSQGVRGLTYTRRLYPHRDRCNGFFIALMKRV